jgi:phosphoribosylformimino-5-aminoimidazole carboxamide ribotide isomerase
MRVIGVIDVRWGRAVHARGGRRAEYAPVEQAAGVRVEGDPLALARVYTETLGLRELYVADLDAIEAGADAVQSGLVRALVACGAPIWLDAAVSRVVDAQRVVELGVSRVIVGLETLGSFRALDDVCAAVGGASVAFSIDLRDGVPMSRPNDMASAATVLDVAVRAAGSGAGTLIVLDVARVGTGAGIDLALVAAIRHAVPDVTLVAGGGVRGASDLRQLAEAGCDGALVATALIEGKLRALE